MTHTPIPYFGGKSSVLKYILPLLPYRDGYCEPYAGGLGVYFARRPVEAETINDFDGRLTTFYEVARDAPDDLADAILATPYSEREFDLAAYNPEHLEPLERARRFYSRIMMGMYAMTRKNNTFVFNTQFKDGSPTTAGTRMKRNDIRRLLKQTQRRMHRTQILNRDAVDVIKWCDAEGYVCYVDPPYPDDVGKNGYFYNDIDHELLAKTLHDYKGFVAISGYPTETMNALYGDWIRHDYDRVVTSSTNQGKNDCATRTESVWTNQATHIDSQETLL